MVAALGSALAITLPTVADNDECDGATVIAPNSATDFNTAGATESSEPFSSWQCSGTYFTATGPDIWFKLHLSSPGALTLSTCRAGSFDTDLSLYTGSCGLLTQVACNGDGPPSSICQPYYSWIEYEALTPGDYFIRVGGYNGTIGEGRLTNQWNPMADCDGDGTPDDQEPDCDGDGLPDDCELDCDQSGVPDDCETHEDCNDNGTPDTCDLSSGMSSDLNLNGVLDECEATVTDIPFVLTGTGGICIPSGPIDFSISGTLLGVRVAFSFINMDEFTWASDILFCIESNDDDEACLQLGGYDLVCSNGCENTVSFPKAWEVTTNGSYDTYVPVWNLDLLNLGDSTLAICNGYGAASALSIWNGTIQFMCLPGEVVDCNSNGIADDQDIAAGTSNDCNENDIPDECDLASTLSLDLDHNGVPDECQQAFGDACETAELIDVDSVTFFSTHNATESNYPTDDDLCPDTFFTDCEPDVWFYLEVPADGNLLLHTCHAESFDTDLALLRGNDCNDLIQIACSGDAVHWAPCQEYYSRIELDIPPGDYFVRLGGYEDAVGSGTLTAVFTPESAACSADLNHDGLVNGADIGLLIAAWGPCIGCQADLTGDNIVSGADVGFFLSMWGPCP